MYYVTRFINFFGSYCEDIGINEANSTGATDIIVVEQSDGSLHSTPFHVRFGKLNILRPKEVIVDIFVNEEYIKEIEMRVEPNGQAYFEVQDSSKEYDKLFPNETKDDNKLFDLDRNIGDEYLPDSKDQSSANPYNDIQSFTSGSSGDGNDQGYRSLDEGFVNYDNSSARRNYFNGLKLSLCGGLSSLLPGDTESMNKFNQSVVTYDSYILNPLSILNDPNLVVLYRNEYLDWKVFSVLAMAQLAFQQQVLSNEVKIKSDVVKSTGYKGWFSWGSGNKDPCTVDDAVILTNAVDNTSKSVNLPSPPPPTPASDSWRIEENLTSTNHLMVYNNRVRTLSGDVYTAAKDDKLPNDVSMITDSAHNKTEEKSFSVDDSAMHSLLSGIKSQYLPSDTLKLLKLKEGVNELWYVITGKYRGTIKVGCKIYLWKWSDRIVISDIDGTITKSDMMGHIVPIIGGDWTHHDVAELFNRIDQNGYKIVYLTARSIGYSNKTRNYLASIKQNDCYLPDGPVLLAPGSFLLALKKELIQRNAEEMKISCLNVLKSIFNLQDNPYPLYSGFGNRPSDEITYKTLGIPQNRIFTVNVYGEVNYFSVEVNFNVQTTYKQLAENVDSFFPPTINSIIPIDGSN